MLDTPTSLLRRLRHAADRESWGEFVSLYEPLLLGYVRKRGLSENDARDVAQNVFISLLRTLPSFDFDRQRGRFRTWLWQVTTHAVIDWHRAQKRVSRAERTWQERQERASGRQPDVVTEEPDQEWTQAFEQRILEYAMNNVRRETQEKTWACFEQHLLRGRPGAEVGTELGLTANAVYVNASRVFARIQEQSLSYLKELDEA